MRLDARELAAIFAGGFLGAIARAELVEALPHDPGEWPWATFVVNVAGAFMLGYFVTRLQERLPLSAYRRPFLGTGLCGALTTFSTMQLELLRMLDGSHIGLAAGVRGGEHRGRLPRRGGRDQPRPAGELHVSLPLVLGIGLFGAVGAIARFLLDGAVSARASSSFPWGTLVVNLTGAFALGFVTGQLSGDAQLLVGTGLLGGYTTFSTWMFESHRLGEDGELRAGVAQSARLAHRSASLAVWLGPDAVSGVKLTVYFGERDRAGDRFLADALCDIFAAHRLPPAS